MKLTSRLMNIPVMQMTDEQYLNADDAEELCPQEEGDAQEAKTNE